MMMAEEAAMIAGDMDSYDAQAILENFGAFERQLDRAYDCYARGRLEAAAVHAAWAADIATGTHCGLFMSPRLEHLLTSIGRNLPPIVRPKRRQSTAKIERVLHISTRFFAVGGHSQMLRRWIKSDPGRVHSIALTQQHSPVAPEIVQAAEASGGRVYSRLNRHSGGLFATVRKLQTLALEYDLCVLHIGNSDVIPSLAFANTAAFPPIVFLNHADHLFWVGSAISSVVGGMREAAMRLAEKRRGITPDRSVAIPILVEPVNRTLRRSVAKQALGISEDQVVLISAARPDKYRTFRGVTYADLHASILSKYPNATLYVVGAGDRPDWADAIKRTGGRIIPLPLQNPTPYMQAADIYLDSYPFCSATSMMEAAGYGAPCVTHFILPEAARICGMDHFGLAGPLIEARSAQEYCDKVSMLIEDPGLRHTKGEEMLECVKRNNMPPAWCEYMEAAFARAQELEPVDNTKLFPHGSVDKPFLGEPDIRIEERYGIHHPEFHLTKEHLSSLPATERLRQWREVAQGRGFVSSKEAMRCLLPEWMVRTLKDIL